MEFVKALPQHFKYIPVNRLQSDEFTAVWSDEYANALCEGLCWTGWHAGTCYGAAGIIQPEEWKGRGEAWALFAPGAQAFMRPIVRFMRYVVSTVPLTRVDMIVADGNEHGHKLAKLCGFEYEARLECYHPTGVDAHMYKRISRHGNGA